jgi:hypothetical protein
MLAFLKKVGGFIGRHWLWFVGGILVVVIVVVSFLLRGAMLDAGLIGHKATATPVVEATTVVAATEVPQETATETALAIATATTTLEPTATAISTPEGQADVRTEVGTMTTNHWAIKLYDGVTDQMEGWAKVLKDPVLDWSKFPNVDFPAHQFLARDGVEYGMAESAYCQQGQTCDINVPAMHYRLITGDYAINGVDTCKKSADTDPGCGIVFFNVGSVTAMLRNQHVDYGFTVEGRYWNGDVLPTTIWALTSNTAFNMLNEGATVLGVSLPVNAGANCSSAFGCKSARLTVVIMSGNQILLVATTVVSK